MSLAQDLVKNDALEDTIISPSKLAHVVMRSGRYDAMVEWYKTVLGARVAYANPMLTFLCYDEEHHRIAVINIPDLIDRPKGSSGVDHVAFTYPSLSTLHATYARVKKKGIAPFWAVNHGPTTSLYYRDPDGNQIELQVDNFDTDEEGQAFFESNEFAENPIGVDFEPEELGRRLASGEAEQAIKKRPNIGPRGLEGVPLQ